MGDVVLGHVTERKGEAEKSRHEVTQGFVAH